MSSPQDPHLKAWGAVVGGLTSGVCCSVLQPTGACDYLEMAGHFDTVFIRNVPLLTLELKDQARRFITLIDTFYDLKVAAPSPPRYQTMYIYILKTIWLF